MKKYRRKISPRPEFPTTAEEIEEAIQEAFQRAAREGLIVDSGKRRWSERTGRYEILWESKIYKPPN
jgi:hypothetical protein